MTCWHTALATRLTRSVHRTTNTTRQGSTSSRSCPPLHPLNLRPYLGPHRRSFSGTLKEQPLSLNHDIYISESVDPYFNLSLEDWLFRHAKPDKPLLVLYRDSPCVVIGRNQNPWTEVNFTALNSARIPFIRRRSGGGTVFHDLGNTNFSIHLPRNKFDRHATGTVVLEAVKALGIDARLNDRNDICVGPDKVSGSAYKIVTQRAYHHGTMLISTRLDQLGDMLRPKKMDIITKGVASVRSPVSNLQQHQASVSHESFTNSVIEAFRKRYAITSPVCRIRDAKSADGIEYIRNGMAELQTWDWLYGQTPEFTQTLRQCFEWGEAAAEIKCKHGIILDVTLGLEHASLRKEAKEALVNFGHQYYSQRRYGFLEDRRHEAETPVGMTIAHQTASTYCLESDSLGLGVDGCAGDIKAWIESATQNRAVVDSTRQPS